MTRVLWSSVAVVLGSGVVALVALTLVLRGRTWAWVVLILAAGVGLREVRVLQRRSHERNAPR